MEESALFSPTVNEIGTRLTGFAPEAGAEEEEFLLVPLCFALKDNAVFQSPNNASQLLVLNIDVSPSLVAVVVGILVSLILVAGTKNASATPSTASLRPVLNTNASEVAVEVETSNADLTKCGKPVVVPLAGNKNALILALGLLGVALLTAAQAANAKKDTKEATTANALNFATCSDVLILLTKGFLSPLS